MLAYIMSSIGCMLGLLLASRARGTEGASRIRWLLGAALSIGGTGIWVMHFIAMMGFQVAGTQIRYDVWLTAASAVLAVVVVGAGMVLVSYGGARLAPLLGGGLLTGLGVAGMHYLGMYAMRMNAHLDYDPLVVALSVLIAVVAATVALWFTLRVRGALATGAAALIMGVAVSGMHYTGMFAISVRPGESHGTPAGAEGIDFLLPMIVGISLLTMAMLLTVLLSPSERELRNEAELMARLRENANSGANSGANGGVNAARGDGASYGSGAPHAGGAFPGDGAAGTAAGHPAEPPNPMFQPRSRPR
ncbi:MHYT domain-containing protein [Thermocatellispora tengchongensis]|uniref:MHYT domain-containing protein n=1 Tax=Thermocatellispora tengchongensis TaxID=1073253 RepID=UPI003642A618